MNSREVCVSIIEVPAFYFLGCQRSPSPGLAIEPRQPPPVLTVSQSPMEGSRIARITH